jgi:serine/threonine protein kinase
MSDLPNLTLAQVTQLIPQASDIQMVGSGGQKLVFKGTIDGKQYAFNFYKVPELPEDLENEDAVMNDVTVRAQREVETIRDCLSDHMVKLGPIELKFDTIDGQNILFFSEEFIVGSDLKTLLRSEGRLTSQEIVKLGLHITDAIQALWNLRKIHRDIKPANIMRREASKAFVLLDPGLAFDVIGESLSIGPVGTKPYFSPEQFDFTNRRSVMDFRSDIFSLGVTMYQLSSGQHPFWTPGETSQSLFNKITTQNPEPPSTYIHDFPKGLDEIIMKMLSKSPHLRYRHCQQLIDALNKI